MASFRYLVETDEAGSKVLGFTIRDTNTGDATLVRTIEEVSTIVGSDGYWASLGDAMAYFTRRPDSDWGAFTVSTNVDYWDNAKGEVAKVVIPRQSPVWYR